MGSECWHQHWGFIPVSHPHGLRVHCSPTQTETGRWNLAFQKLSATSATLGVFAEKLGLRDGPRGPEGSGKARGCQQDRLLPGAGQSPRQRTGVGSARKNALASLRRG